MIALRRIWIGLLMLVSAAVFAQTVWASVVVEKFCDTRRAFYFSDSKVYYVPEQHVYWYFDHGVWRSGPSVPPGLPRDSVIEIPADHPAPWLSQ